MPRQYRRNSDFLDLISTVIILLVNPNSSVQEEPMTDILIRGVSDDDLRNLDACAKRLGLSRNQYLQRVIAQFGTSRPPVTVVDLQWFCDAIADLSNEDFESRAWA